MRLVYVACAWALGLWWAYDSGAAHGPLIYVWLLGAGVAAVCAWRWRPSSAWRPSLQQHTARAHLFLLMVLALCLGGARMGLVPRTSPIADYNNSGGLTLEGIVMAAPDVRDNVILLRLSSETLTRNGYIYPINGDVLVQAPPTAAHIRYGDRIQATGQLVMPADGDTFSYSDYLARQGIFSVMRDTSITFVSAGHGAAWYGALLAVRDTAAARIDAALPEPQAALLSGILLGDQRGLARSVSEAFNVTGIAHVVAISGFNMAVLSGVVLALLRPWQRQLWTTIVGVGVLALYALFVGASASVVRAAVMASLPILAAALRRETYLPATLAFALLAMSAFSPMILWDVGFQLSFLATLGLALFANGFSEAGQRALRRLLPARIAAHVGPVLLEPITVTLAASVLTLPLTALYFARVSLVMLPVNLLVVPIQAYILLMGLAAAGVALVAPSLAQPLFWAVLPPLAWTIDTARAWATLPFAGISVIADGRWIMVGIGGVLMMAIVQGARPPWLDILRQALRRRAVIAAGVVCGGLCLALLVALWFSRPDGRLHLWLLHLGHSNAVLIQTPNGAQILVDGGRFPSQLLTAVGDRMAFNDRMVDVLFITQPDENEYQALNSLAARYQIGMVVTHGQRNDRPAWAQLNATLAATPQMIARGGMWFDTSDGVRIEVLHPLRTPDVGQLLDDHSLLLRVRYGEVSFLLTGDLSGTAQRALIEQNAIAPSTVVQIPQHGAARALYAPLLAAAQPSLAIVQADPANRFGDPDGDTLALLGTTPLWRTDQRGTLHLWSDGAALWIVGER
jgi:competence protein ComEC